MLTWYNEWSKRIDKIATKAIFATLVAKPGMEEQVEAFLKSAKPLVDEEPGTVNWYAVKLDERRYAIFDTFQQSADRELHLHGKIATALMTEAPRLFESAPVIQNYDILAEK